MKWKTRKLQDFWQRSQQLNARGIKKTPYAKLGGIMKTEKLYSASAKTDYKKGKREGWGNYKPVSLKSVPGKIMERIMLGAVEKQVEDKAIISLLLAAHSLQTDSSYTPDFHILFPASVKLAERKTWFCLFYEIMLFHSNKLVSCCNWRKVTGVFLGFSYWTNKRVRLKTIVCFGFFLN